jgi:hypothetical protein
VCVAAGAVRAASRMQPNVFGIHVVFKAATRPADGPVVITAADESMSCTVGVLILSKFNSRDKADHEKSAEAKKQGRRSDKHCEEVVLERFLKSAR